MSDDESLEESKAPLIDHLIELRQRLVRSLIALAIAFLVCYYFSGNIYAFLVRPLAEVLGPHSGHRMIYTGLHEAFFTYVKVALFAAIVVTFPIIAIQIWKFVAPGLYKNERRAFLPFMFATPILFIAGAALVYYFIFPAAWKFFLSFERPPGPDSLPIELEARVSEYLSLVTLLMFSFGLVFQLPILLMLLGRAGLITANTLVEKRKYAIVITFAVAAVLTPPDPFSQIGMGLSIMALYEVSIWLLRFAERKRRREAPDLEP